MGLILGLQVSQPYRWYRKLLSGKPRDFRVFWRPQEENKSPKCIGTADEVQQVLGLDYKHQETFKHPN